ncbi:AAA family ATPase [Anaerosolibacter sp.]|uniref:AAA family ATPase n=1 Tax=Anaerosolibacter sp. TaxID=1872527 RepID=UPI0039EEBA7D
MGKVINLFADASTTSKSSIPKLNQNTLYILIGLPGSGKTTYANKCFHSKDILIVSSDQIRQQITGSSSFNKGDTAPTLQIAQKIIQEALESGLNVVWDATNIYKKWRKDFIKIAKKNNAKVVAIVFNTPVSICVKRNNERTVEKQVPNEIIVEMSKASLSIDKREGFHEVIYI